jgi:hypothetical protein
VSTESGPTNPFAAIDGASDPPPRLSIQYMMGWTAATAVYLAIGRNLWADSLARQKDDLFAMFMWVAWSPLQGAYVAGLMLFVIRRLRGRWWRLHPGDWLFVVFGVQCVLYLMASGLLYTLLHDAQDQFRYYTAVMTVQTAIRLLAAALVLIVSRWLKPWPIWRAFFWFTVPYFLLTSCLRGLWRTSLSVAMASLYLPPVIFSIVVIAVALVDLRRAERHPWTHWSAVGTEALAGLLSALVFVHHLLTSN